MIFDRTGIFEPYTQIGKNIDEIEDRIHLPQQEQTNVEPLALNSTIWFNSTYMELVDKIYHERGTVTFFGLMICIPVIIFVIAIYIICLKKIPAETFDIIDLLFILFTTISCMGLIYFVYLFLLKQDTFSYTHYPIRFNRKNKMVYSFRPDGTVGKYRWDDLYVALMVSKQDIRQPHKSTYDVRFNVLDTHRVITDAFALPYCHEVQYDPDQLVYRGLWEYVRRYMEERMIDSYNTVDQLLPLRHQRETFWQSIKLGWEILGHGTSTTLKKNKQTGVYEENIEEQNKSGVISLLIHGLFFNLIMTAMLGRYAIAKLAKRPVWPKWVEEECQVDADDPYDLDRYPKPKAARPPFTFTRAFVYGITAVLAYLNIYATLWCFDLIAMAKDADISLHGLLEFWQWFG